MWSIVGTRIKSWLTAEALFEYQKQCQAIDERLPSGNGYRTTCINKTDHQCRIWDVTVIFDTAGGTSK